ncbi:heme lyase CcmF/NrfE family subunit [Marinomonas colpomeniae]|uniref:Heme lyase CcmF/NrfE family subunit n=1 Tax=Marinomonas colpomeniae TaxID=2774408 RepID=A0ABR8NUY9_9GAMM|nr:heme lyase CcmF/NrfE family subunit [Marinomonas colpomeniae]MBD5769859.1 heme lyase CcmF/NrfE family subunit [Marinomonas colpomeniae]
MLPEIGQFSLILSLFFAISLALVPLLGYWKNNQLLLATARPLTFIMSTLVLMSFIVLSLSFLMDDFSVLYVSQTSNSQLPIYYKFSALWGGHEGSLLLWVLVLCGWSSAVALKIRNLPEDIGPVVLAILGMVCSGFLSFLIFTSSPFIRLLPDSPIDGGDLNPLLQDFGLIVHPPVLYMGYVGFSVAFAFAVAALITGNLNAAWARWARPWTTASWAFLTLGITLGSWWAYYELGWGGWWFWDPVENASFMPWLAGTALLHSLAVTEKRGVFKSWTVLLAIFTFSLSLLGAFLVRSGVLTSVHSFAADSTRGIFILVLLLIFVGGSLLLYAIRAVQVRSSVSFGVTGREAWLLLNNILLTVLTLTVLLGTLYPLLFDALGLGKISVGAPYFNSVFTPIALLLIVFMGVGPLSKWHNTKLNVFLLPCIISMVVSVLISGSLVYAYDLGLLAWLSLSIAFWVVCLSFSDWFSKVSVGTKGIIPRARQLPRNYYGMLLAHLGIVVSLVGVVLVSINSQESMVRLSPGEQTSVAGYEFRFDRLEQVQGPNYVSDKAQFTAYKNGQVVALLYPEKRLFNARQQVMTEAALDAGFTRDLYISLGEKLDGDSWGVRVYVKSFVRWIWLGGLLMMVGGLLATLDKRYQRRAGV